ncbi:PaaI family thioesterase [Roseivivax sediminis]|uniref:Uncharacterized domain 1-containing protein n=1 Tax=Roseivivax sediminis TaxID=936889 RepID=A0A1I1ZAJ3_9RHOB|nr:PaaI family thioesterase [Roseivivax sediminis]SFE28699.1 uncharacterized domain 1-containing protein [Roseivivax sediminis]
MTLIRDETGTQRTLGYVIDVADPESARCHLDVTDAHTNRHDVLHGGIVTLLLDSAMGATGSLSIDPEGRAPFLTVSITTQFLAAACAGERVTASGRITGGGRSLLFISGELASDSGALIATATGVFKRVPPKTA